MSYQIVTDSACNLTEETIDAFGLEILPLTFMVDGVQHRSYLKGEKTDLRQFYTMMREGKVITTSLPNMQETETTLRRVLDAGHDVLYLGFSSALSGTYEATELLMKQLAGEYPDARSAQSKHSRHRAAKACSYIWPARKRKQAHRLKKSPISCAKRATTCATGLPSMI